MIGVCIKYFHENYGGMLQAFATVKMLESRGIDYELIRYKKKLTITEKIRSVPRLLNGILLNDKYEAFLKRQGMKKHPEFAKPLKNLRIKLLQNYLRSFVDIKLFVKGQNDMMRL